MKKIDPTLAGATTGDHLGKRFAESRQAAGMKRKDAASAIGISPAQLGRIERGGVEMVSDPASIVRAAAAYGVSQVWLYAGSSAGDRFVPSWYSLQPTAAAA